MCVTLCKVLIILTLVHGILYLCVILFNSGTLITIIRDRTRFLENQFQLYDGWAKQPLRQTHKFYFFNITNGDQFFRSDTPMTVDEIGPFVYDSLDSNQTIGPDGYNVSSLSLENLRFNLSESVGDESVSLYTLNIPLIRRLSFRPHSLLEPLDEDLVRIANVRNILSEIVDGYGFSSSRVESFPINIFKEFREHAFSNYLQYLRNEICLRLFKVAQFVNPPTIAKSGRFFRKFPCDCLVVTPNGTESMGREDPKYADIQTSKYLVLWDDDKCAESFGDPSVPIQRDRYVTENLFSVSSVAHWRDDDCVQYGHQTENSSETRIKVEQFSDVITDFSFEYQLNIPIKFREVSRERVNNYPVLRTVTSGASVEDVDSSIYRYIVYPRKGTNQYKSDVTSCGISLLIGYSAAIILWAYRRVTTGINAQ